MSHSRRTAGRALAGGAGVGYVATAWIHSTGYDSITQLAREGPEELATVMPALWLVLSLDLVVLALVLAVVAWRPGWPGRLLAGIAALCPLGAAGLQLRFIGFIPPTAILLTIGGLALSAALLLPGRGATTEGTPDRSPSARAT